MKRTFSLLVLILGSVFLFSFEKTFAQNASFQEANLDLKAANAATEAAALKGGEPLPNKPYFSIKKILERVQTYLNSFTTFHARFRQEDPDGTLRFGELYIQRPGKMNLNYLTPSPLLVISDGSWISYDDKDLNQISYVPLSSTPAIMMLGDKIDFQSTLVDKVEFSPENEIQITIRNKSDPEIGTLILTLKDNPLKLSGWQVVDQTTQITTVTLKDLEVGITPPPGSFELSDPHQS